MLKTRTGVSLLAVLGLAATSLVATNPASFAGTGGISNSGIIYGEGAHYCEVSNLAIVKTDAQTGRPLSGAVFTIQAAAGVGVKAGTYAQAPKTNSPTLGTGTNSDKDMWQKAFNQQVDKSWTASAFGAKYLAAQVKLKETAGNGSDPDGTAGTNMGGGTSSTTGETYTPTEVVLFPNDIRGLTNASVQAAMLAGWEASPVEAGKSQTPAAFEAQAKARLDAIGAVMYATYNPATPTAPATAATAPLAGSRSATQVATEYTRAYNEWQNIRSARAAAAAGNYTAFTTAYNALVAANAWSFGIKPADYELIKATIGAAAVTAANQAADKAVGATYVGDGAAGGKLTLTADANGRITYSVFGRLGARKDGALTNGDCSALVTTVTEVTAPEGYKLDATARTMTPGNISGTGVETLTVPNTPDIRTVPGPEPESPQFESGK